LGQLHGNCRSVTQGDEVLKEDSLFFVRVREVYEKKAVTCMPTATITQLTHVMKEKNVSGVLVVDEDIPIGVVTDQDLRDKVLAKGLDPRRVYAESVMSYPVFTIREEDFLSEAIYKMLKNKVHRLAVVDENGELIGIITDIDIIRVQTDTALYFMGDLEAASSVSDVTAISNRMIGHIDNLFKAEIKPKDLVRLISYLNDLILVKVIKLLLANQFGELPARFAFLVLGSEGRMEQTLKTDQDNAIVYSDHLSERDLCVLEDFSTALIDSLIHIGFPSCPGGIMAKNAAWRRSLSDWKETVKEWVRTPTPDNLLNYSMLSDLRTVYGDFTLEAGLKETVLSVVKQNPVFLAHMANNTLRFKPPLNFLGGFKVEKSGPNKGKLDIKMAGLFPLTEGIKVLALEAGIMDGGTNEKIAKLLGRNIVPDDELAEVEASFNFFVHLRLKSQLRQVTRSLEPGNYIDPLDLDQVEKERLKVGFSMVKSFQRFLADRFKVSFLAA
jgi:CBS domain-containing protein